VQPVWTPPDDVVEQAEMTRLLETVGARDYNELWQWSVDHPDDFWRYVWDRFDVLADGDAEPVLRSRSMPGAEWFPGARLSFPEHVFRDRRPTDPAVWFASESAPLAVWSWAELERETARIRAGLVSMGVRAGDRVGGYLPNVPETVAAFLAVSSLGAIWSCCSPDFGTRTVVDRFVQIEPKILLAADAYTYGGRRFDRREEVGEIARSLPTLERVVSLSGWDEAFPHTDEPLAFERVPFDHPLWIVYSSGTTGQPKAIVHGHGGPLLEHLKMWRLHHDVKSGDRVMWFTSTGWIMWNYLVSALLSPVSIVLYDGSPGYPDLSTLWRIADESGASLLGGGAAYFHACMKAGLSPRSIAPLSGLRSIGSTGSPLAPAAYRWVADEVGPHVWLASTSGGTDIAGAFLGGSPLMPVYAGELPSRLLGVAVEAWDDDGRALVDEVGELVVTKPMPSMPVRFWNDPDGARYRESYFEKYPGVWRHGDWVRITPRGSAVIYGRSDATINRGGIRIGTAEIYAAVLAVPGVADALVVDVPSFEDVGDARMVLFVVPAEGAEVDEALASEIRARLRSDCSPRHVPDEVHAVREVPRTLTGKLLEVPVKRLLMGQPREQVVNEGTVANPAALEWFVDFARNRTGVGIQTSG
jgi:acetoacetyl-CoA synthetase